VTSSDTALCRAERDVVLDSVPCEHFDRAVVHLHRTRHDNLTLGFGEDFPDAGIEVQDAGRHFEFLQHGPEHGLLAHTPT
jgi:hypothetical protein